MAVKRWVKRVYRRLVTRYVTAIERAVERAVRRELRSVAAFDLSGDGTAEGTQGSEMAAAQQALDACRTEFEQFRKDALVRSGLNQAGYRDHIAYRGYPDSAIFVNIGAGGFSHPRWTNLDVTSQHYESHRSAEFVEYDLNRCEPLPFPDESVALVYTSHTIEHVKDEPVRVMFREVERVLEPGGIFRVTCPDAHLYYLSARAQRLDRFFYRMNTWFRRFEVEDRDVTPVDFISKGVATGVSSTPLIRDTNPDLHEDLMTAFERMGEEEFLEYLCSKVDFSIAHVARHVNWWTHAKVLDTLGSAGFGRCWVSTFGGSIAPPMCDTSRFDNTVRDESLYVEAMK